MAASSVCPAASSRSATKSGTENSRARRDAAARSTARGRIQQRCMGKIYPKRNRGGIRNPEDARGGIDFLRSEADDEGMGIERTMLAAQGYIELEMPNEALRELDALDPQDQEREEVLQLRLFILMRSRRWAEALGVCARLREKNPEQTTGYIHGAFCLHELGRTAEAKEMLLKGPASLLGEATYYYNMGCYDAVLGNLEEAEHALKISFKMDDKFREIAKYDPDLKSVAELL